MTGDHTAMTPASLPSDRPAVVAASPLPQQPVPDDTAAAVTASTASTATARSRRARIRARMTHLTLQTVPLIIGALTLLITAGQIGSELEQTRQAEERALAISSNVQMLRAASDYRAAINAFSLYQLQTDFADHGWSRMPTIHGAIVIHDLRYLDLQHAVYSAHDEVANSFNELLVYGEPGSIAAARTLLDEMPDFATNRLPLTPAYARAQNDFVTQMCWQLSQSRSECDIKIEH